MVILSILQIILYLLVIPFSMGLAFTRFFDEKHNTIGNILTSGFIMELAAFQVLFLAFYSAGTTANALFIIDHCVVVNNRNRSLRARSRALATGNAAEAAGFPYGILIFFL